MTREELERALRETPLPDEVAARERARRTVVAVHAETAPRRAVRGARLAWVAALALVAAVAVTQRDSRPARAFVGLVRDVVAEPTPTPTPVSGFELPAGGRLLVSDADGLWIVERRGRRTRLGRWDDATWSPRGLFVGATHGRTLAALDPGDRTVRWRLVRPERVSLPRWAPDGTHIAYRSGRTLRIVYGNGLHDVRAGDRMAPVAPAWRPGSQPVVAWAALDGTVTVEHAETAKVLWKRGRGQARHLAWSADGRRLLIAGRRNGTIYDLATGTRERVRLAAGAELLAAAFAPTGNRLALAVRTGDQTTVRVQGEPVLAGAGLLRDLQWSPDGRWLLAGWPTADHWLLVRASGHARESAVSGVRHRFGHAERTHGWCC